MERPWNHCTVEHYRVGGEAEAGDGDVLAGNNGAVGELKVVQGEKGGMAEGGGEEEAENGQMVMLPHVGPVTVTLSRGLVLSVPKVSRCTVLAGKVFGVQHCIRRLLLIVFKCLVVVVLQKGCSLL